MFPLLDFVVVGGGIAGLSTAWSLQRAGHHVTLFERQSVLAMSKCREGIRSTPAMTHVLDDWGIRDAFEKISTPINQMIFLDGKTGEELGLIPVSKMMEHFPAEFRSLQFRGLFTLFHGLAKEAGVVLHFDTEVVSVDPWNATVTCNDGTQVSVDVVIGADGAESLVRHVVLGSSAPIPDIDNRFSVGLVVPVDEVRKHNDLAPLIDERSWTSWFADDCSMHGVLAGLDYYLITNIAIHDDDVWEEFPMSLESLRASSYDSRGKKILRLSEQISKTVANLYEPFDDWVHESGKVVLVGDAAHPILPCGSHNYSTGIEDAMTLSVLFSVFAAKSQIPMLLNAFEELRQPRCAAIQYYVRRKREVITVPRGPGQRRRDELLRNQRACHQEDEADDDFLYNTYSGFVQVNGFDVREAVQDWWVKWGRSVLTRSPEGVNGNGVKVEVDDDDGPALVPIVVDAEVERDGPTYPTISDLIMGDDEYVVREAEAHRRSQR